MERSATSAREGTLYALLCDRLAVLEPCAVAAVTRVFLEVSLMPCGERLWSLEFAFDQDDGRIARVVACFVDRNAKGVRRDGLVVYRVKNAGRGRVMQRVMSPVECLARLAAMVPPPRYPLLRLHGVLAARHPWRARVVPRPPESQAGCTSSSSKKRKNTSSAAEAALVATASAVPTSTLLVGHPLAPHLRRGRHALHGVRSAHDGALVRDGPRVHRPPPRRAASRARPIAIAA